MCRTCDMNPCHRKCPESRRPPPVISKCEWCCEDVYADEESKRFYYNIYIHKECIEEMSAEELTDILGAETVTEYDSQSA